MKEKIREACEWNPGENRPAKSDDKFYHANEAVYRVGLFHLCAHCANLSQFKRFKKHELRKEK
jgi:hypothetical protein